MNDGTTITTVDRIALTDGTGLWFDRVTSQEFDADWETRERLYLTDGGNFIINRWMEEDDDFRESYHAVPDLSVVIAWLTKHGHNPNDVEASWGNLGDRIKGLDEQLKI